MLPRWTFKTFYISYWYLYLELPLPCFKKDLNKQGGSSITVPKIVLILVSRSLFPSGAGWNAENMCVAYYSIAPISESPTDIKYPWQWKWPRMEIVSPSGHKWNRAKTKSFHTIQRKPFSFFITFQTFQI